MTSFLLLCITFILSILCALFWYYHWQLILAYFFLRYIVLQRTTGAFIENLKWLARHTNYTPVVSIRLPWIGGFHVVQDLELQHKILLDRDDTFNHSVDKLQRLVGSKNLLVSRMRNNLWYHHRQAVRPLLEVWYLEHQCSIVQQLLSEWEITPNLTLQELMDSLEEIIIRIRCRLFFNMTLSPEQQSALSRLMVSSLHSTGQALFFRYESNEALHKCEQADAIIRDAVQEAIIKRKDFSESNSKSTCMLDLLLRAKANGVIANDDELYDSVYLYMYALTPAYAAVWAIVHLETHPHILAKVLVELETAKVMDVEITYDMLCSLKTLYLVLIESMRLYPPIPVFVGRQYSSNVSTIDTYTLNWQRGDNVFMSALVAYRNPKYFSSPDSFEPFRSELIDDQHQLVHFGAGPRQCVGRLYGIMEAKLLILEWLKKSGEQSRIKAHGYMRSTSLAVYCRPSRKSIC